MGNQIIGKITHYFPNVGVAVVKLGADLKQGEKIKIEGKGIEFEQGVDSMQVDKKNIDMAKAGDEIGLKVDQEVKPGCQVFKV